MSDTPRTDTELANWNHSPEVKALVKLSRTLERELTASQAEIERLRGEVEKAYKEGYSSQLLSSVTICEQDAFNRSTAKRWTFNDKEAMNPKDLERLERFAAAALSGLCANHEMIKIAIGIDKEEKVAEGRTISCVAVAIAAQTINTLNQYASNQPVAES